MRVVAASALVLCGQCVGVSVLIFCVGACGGWSGSAARWCPSAWTCSGTRIREPEAAARSDRDGPRECIHRPMWQNKAVLENGNSSLTVSPASASFLSARAFLREMRARHDESWIRKTRIQVATPGRSTELQRMRSYRKPSTDFRATDLLLGVGLCLDTVLDAEALDELVDGDDEH
eukprot:624967-Rhodomonas_salina.1